jgi:hypothetical protein
LNGRAEKAPVLRVVPAALPVNLGAISKMIARVIGASVRTVVVAGLANKTPGDE